MSISNNIQILLDIQDPNMIFGENCVQEGEYRGKPCKYVFGKLTYTPNCCEVCGVRNENYTIYKNGTQVSRITLPITGVNPTYLYLKKQRFLCKGCGNSFTAKSPIVKRHCHISENVRSQVIVKSAEAQSLKSIAQDCSVSQFTVQRFIHHVAQIYKHMNRSLPQHLSFDEFKYAKGMMAFEYIHSETGDILDILPERTNWAIRDHFIVNYSLKERNQVRTVTVDMNAGYVNVIKGLFPNAKIIIDRFHLVQLISRAMNQCRVRIMNQFKTSNNEAMKKYRRLKRYWRLLLKKERDLSSTVYKYYPLFGQRTGRGIVEEILGYSAELRANYELYQRLLATMTDQNFTLLSTILAERESPLISSQMKTSLKTLRQHLPYIENSFRYPYNNGRIEGINNKIKVLNRVAYGYRNFLNYKHRILLHFKFKPIEKVIQKQSGIEAA